MRRDEILRQPTTIDDVHESYYRSYHILAKVLWMLEKGTPPAVVLDYVDDLVGAPQVKATRTEDGKVSVEVEP